VKRRLAQLKSNSAIAGIYVLDDYPGNIANILSDVHSVVAEDNKTEAFSRGTVCAFGATLDARQTPQQSWTSEQTYYMKAAVNFSPLACDYVALYPYAPQGFQDSQVDWSMSQLLPYLLARLAARGWTAASAPLIGIPQAFGYVAEGRYAPTGPDIRSQTIAFCKGGARSIIAYAWDDSYSGRKLELFNDSDMRAGFTQGLAVCGLSKRPNQ
jgi:hypothetical protein